MTRSITIFGHGPVGRETAALLAGRGDQVHVAQRRTPAELPKGVRFRAVDLLDGEATRAACAGSDTVVCTAGFPYRASLWEKVWPRAMDNLIAACATTGARFVFADNLYMYGPQTTPLREDMALTTFGRKPKVRAHITRQWQDAHAKGRIKAVALRASDFYGARVPNSVLAEFGVARFLAGKPALVPMPPDEPHDITYVPDFARAIVTLIDAPDTDYGQAWHVPNAPTQSVRALLERAAALIGVAPRISVMPALLRALAAPFVPALGEFSEMSFQFDRPYHVDATKFARRFWADATPFDVGLKATIAGYR